MKWSPAVGAAADPAQGIDRLIPLGIVEALVDVRRERNFAGRLTFETDQPASVTKSFQESDRPELLPVRNRRPGRASASHVPGHRPPREEAPPLSRRTRVGAATAPARRGCRSRPRARRRAARKLREDPMLDRGRTPVDTRAASTHRAARVGRCAMSPTAARNRGAPCPSGAESSLGAMDSLALERAKQRISDAAAGRPEPAALEAALERSRFQIEAFAVTAAELEASIPAQVGVPFVTASGRRCSRSRDT